MRAGDPAKVGLVGFAESVFVTLWSAWWNYMLPTAGPGMPFASPGCGIVTFMEITGKMFFGLFPDSVQASIWPIPEALVRISIPAFLGKASN